MTYAMLLQILLEAEQRVAESEDAGVRERSQETVDLCNERLRRDGLTRDDLVRLAGE
jgi:hypothetical protein